MTNARRRQLEAKTIRIALLVIGATSAISMIAALFPHYSKWQDGTLLETYRPGLGYIGFALGAAVPAALVWWKPRPMIAFAWGVYLWVFAIVVFAATFDLNFDLRSYTTLHHPAETVFELSALPAAFAAFVIVPSVAVVYSIATTIIDVRAKRAAIEAARPAQLPIARVV